MKWLFYCLLSSLLACNCSDRPKKDLHIVFPKGGYAYPKNTLPGDDSVYFVYPMKDSLSRKDSLGYISGWKHFFKSFDEPNLSIQPPADPVLRITSENRYSNYYFLIVMKQNEIRIKEISKGSLWPSFADSLLTEKERNHLDMYRNFRFPLEEYQGNKVRKRYVDSMLKANPVLLDPKYYTYLIEKSSYIDRPFAYKEIKRSISDEKFKYFINKINDSEFWKFNLLVDTFSGNCLHEDFFSMEIATQTQYQFVNFANCKTIPKMTPVFYEIIEYAGLEDGEEKWIEKQRKNR